MKRRSILLTILKKLIHYDKEIDDITRWRSKGAQIGNNVFVEGVLIEESFADLLTIEDDVVIAAHTVILFHDSSLNNLFGMPVKFGRVIIRKGAYIGANSTILCGVEIGEGSLIGAASLVTRDIPPGVVAVGSPARIISTTLELSKKQSEEIKNSNKYYFLDILPWRDRVKSPHFAELVQKERAFVKNIKEC